MLSLLLLPCSGNTNSIKKTWNYSKQRIRIYRMSPNKIFLPNYQITKKWYNFFELLMVIFVEQMGRLYITKKVCCMTLSPCIYLFVFDNFHKMTDEWYIAEIATFSKMNFHRMADKWCIADTYSWYESTSYQEPQSWSYIQTQKTYWSWRYHSGLEKRQCDDLHEIIFLHTRTMFFTTH